MKSTSLPANTPRAEKTMPSPERRQGAQSPLWQSPFLVGFVELVRWMAVTPAKLSPGVQAAAGTHRRTRLPRVTTSTDITTKVMPHFSGHLLWWGRWEQLNCNPIKYRERFSLAGPNNIDLFQIFLLTVWPQERGAGGPPRTGAIQLRSAVGWRRTGRAGGGCPGPPPSPAPRAPASAARQLLPPWAPPAMCPFLLLPPKRLLSTITANEFEQE